MIDLEATNAIYEISEHRRRIALQRRLIAQLTKYRRHQAAEEARSLLDQMTLALSRMQQRAERSSAARPVA